MSGKCVRYFDVMLNLYRLQALVRGLHMANLAGTGVLDTVRVLGTDAIACVRLTRCAALVVSQAIADSQRGMPGTKVANRKRSAAMVGNDNGRKNRAKPALNATQPVPVDEPVPAAEPPAEPTVEPTVSGALRCCVA